MTGEQHRSAATDPDSQPEAATPAVSARVRGADLFAPPYGKQFVGVLTLIVFIAFESIAVATAMPVIVGSLHGLAFYAWGFSALVVGQLFATIVAGEWCDTSGPRRSLAVGAALFGAGLLVAGTAPSMFLFVLGRFLQGLGSGGVMVSTSVVVGRGIPEPLRPRAFSFVSTAWLLPGLIGPVVAGAVADHLSWRVLFLGLFVVLPVPLFLTEPRLGHLRLDPADAAPRKAGRKRLAAAVALGIAAAQYAGQTLQWWSVLLAAAGLALAAPSAVRLLPPRTFRAGRGIPAVVLQAGILAGCFFGAESFIPLALVQVRGLSPTLAGVTLTVGSIGWALGSWYQGRPDLAVTRTRLVRSGSALVTFATAVVFTIVWPQVPAWTSAAVWVLGAGGMGLSMASLSVLLFANVSHTDAGQHSAAMQLSNTLGSVTMVGLAGVLFAYLHPRTGAVGTFMPIGLSMAVLGLAGVWVAGRLPSDARTHQENPAS